MPFLRPDLDFADLVGSLHSPDVPVQGVMHTHVDLTRPALGVVRSRFDGPALACPDSGYFEMPHWQFVDIVSPEKLAAAAKAWIEDDGVRLVGGCCGLGVEHVEALAEMVATG